MPQAAAGIAVVGGLMQLTSQFTDKIKENKATKISKQIALDLGAEQYKMLMAQADAVEEARGFELGRFDTQAGQFLGSQETAIALSGIEGEGSAALISQDSRENLAIDRTNLFDRYQVQIDELRKKATLAAKYGVDQATLLGIQNTSSMLSGVSQAFGTAANTASSFYNIGSNAGWWG